MAETPNKDLLIERQITDITDNFPIFSCFDCGAAIKNFVKWINSFCSPIQDLGRDFQIDETEF